MGSESLVCKRLLIVSVELVDVGSGTDRVSTSLDGMDGSSEDLDRRVIVDRASRLDRLV